MKLQQLLIFMLTFCTGLPQPPQLSLSTASPPIPTIMQGSTFLIEDSDSAFPGRKIIKYPKPILPSIPPENITNNPNDSNTGADPSVLRTAVLKTTKSAGAQPTATDTPPSPIVDAGTVLMDESTAAPQILSSTTDDGRALDARVNRQLPSSDTMGPSPRDSETPADTKKSDIPRGPGWSEPSDIFSNNAHGFLRYTVYFSVIGLVVMVATVLVYDKAGEKAPTVEV